MEEWRITEAFPITFMALPRHIHEVL
jgi:hypothetical protein